MSSPLSRFLCPLLLLVCASGAAVAATAVSYDPSQPKRQPVLTIVVVSPSQVADKEERDEACKFLTQGLTRRVLPVGDATFKAGKCVWLPPKKVAAEQKKAGWYATLRLDQKPPRLDLEWRPAPSATMVPLSTVPLPKPDIESIVTSGEILAHAGSLALSGSPVAAVINASKLQSAAGKPLSLPPSGPTDIYRPQTVRLYGLTWLPARQEWEPTVYADVSSKGGAAYQGPWQRRVPVDRAIVFAHDAAGPSAAAAVWRDRLDAAVIANESRMANLLSSQSSLPRGMALIDSFGQVGLRLGQQMATGSELIADAKYLSVYLEATGRYIGGLRVSMEMVPTVKVEIDGAMQEFGWTRYALGYAFGINLGWLIDRIEIQPRASIWALKAVVPYENLDNPVPEEFTVDNQMSQGVSLALIAMAGDFLFKPWYARDIEIPVRQLKIGGAVVQTTTVGMDVYYSRLSWRVAGRPIGIMAFGLGEAISIAKGGEDEEDVKRRIDIDDFFGGMGILMAL